jgi:hypothetical protein
MHHIFLDHTYNFTLTRDLALSDEQYQSVRFILSKPFSWPRDSVRVNWQGSLFPRRVSFRAGGVHLFQIAPHLTGGGPALPEFASLVDRPRLVREYLERYRKDWGLRQLTPEREQEARTEALSLYRTLAAAYDDFVEAVLPSPGHADMYGGGDDSYETEE